MCECCRGDKKTELLDAVLTRYGADSGNIITILQKAQEIYGWLPREVILRVAEKTKLPPARVLGVATFYTQFRLSPAGKNMILLCKGTACHVNGADGVEKAICGHLGISDGGTTDDGLFSYKSVACLGCCSLSPAMMINETTYGSLTGAKAVAVIEALKNAEMQNAECRKSV